MTWYGLASHESRQFVNTGLDSAGSDAQLGPMLERGSLIFETRVCEDARPTDLIGFDQPYPWPRASVFRAIPGGGIAFLHRHNTETTHAAIQWANDGRATTLRVTYAWDGPAGWGRLALERPECSGFVSQIVQTPRPYLTSDLRAMILDEGGCDTSCNVLFSAVSDQSFPLGPMPSLAVDTPIATPSGFRSAGALKRGDTVVTDTGAIVPVLHAVRLSVPAHGSFAPVRLRAPSFGLHRDIVVAPEQRLVLKGSEVEYIFGQEAVLVPARHLVNGRAAVWHKTSSTIEYVQLVLPGHDALVAAGCALESLYIGRIRRDPERLAATVLADVPRRLLPEHARPIHKVLGSFEAVTLVSHRAA